MSKIENQKSPLNRFSFKYRPPSSFLIYIIKNLKKPIETIKIFSDTFLYKYFKKIEIYVFY
jgi:hypothetical protein